MELLSGAQWNVEELLNLRLDTESSAQVSSQLKSLLESQVQASEGQTINWRGIEIHLKDSKLIECYHRIKRYQNEIFVKRNDEDDEIENIVEKYDRLIGAYWETTQILTSLISDGSVTGNQV